MIRLVVTGDVSDWNIPDFSVTRLPEEIRATIASADLFVPDLEGQIDAGGVYPRFTLGPSPLAAPLIELALRGLGKLQPRVSSSPAILDLLELGKRTCVVLANNHVKDLGRAGLVDTLALLRERGLGHVGAGVNRRQANAPARLEVEGKPFVILAYNYIGLRRSGLFLNLYGAGRKSHGAGYLPLRSIRARIRRLRTEAPGAFVLLVLHAGRVSARSVETTNIPYRKLEEVGADCVVCHHSHRHFGQVSPRCFLIGDLVFSHPGEGGLAEDRPGGFVELLVDGATNRYRSVLHTYTFDGGVPAAGTVVSATGSAAVHEALGS